MAVVYRDFVGLFFLKDPTGWHLVWLSPRLHAPVDRITLTSKISHTLGTGNVVAATNTNASYAPNSSTAPVNHVTIPLASGLQSSQPITINLSTTTVTSVHSNLSATTTSAPSDGRSISPPPLLPQSTVPNAHRATCVCMIAVALGSRIFLWCLYPSSASAASSGVASCGGVLGVCTAPTSYCVSSLTPVSSRSSGDQRGHHASLIRAKEPWGSDLIGRYDLNGRAVDYIMFIDTHLVALSRRGLVGVRHVMTTTWQVWSTVPILSYSVAASELLLLGCANGRICSINIQKFPLRIVDNDLLVTEIYRDPLQDPITALSVHLMRTASPGRMEIAYGTLSGRVCLIVQYPENVGYSPQLLQTFTVHRAMVTRVVLSERHLISVCSEFNHVRTWAVTRFRGIISTQPGSTPIASFYLTTLDTNNSNGLVQSVVDAVRRCTSKSSTHKPREALRAHSNLTPLQTTVVAQSQLPSSAVQQQQQSRQPRTPHPQSFRFPHWRRQGSYSRSPGGTLDYGAGADADPSRSVTDTDVSLVRRNTTSLPPTGRGQSTTLDHLGAGRQSEMSHVPVVSTTVCNSGLLVLPHTSWLHEDPGTVSTRTGLVASGPSEVTALSNECANRVQASSPPTNLFGPLLSRCQTFHGVTDPDSPHTECRALLSNTLPASSTGHGQQISPTIQLHRHANDPGPYGEREDVLVFVQKLTPHAHQLFVRLAATGKRVCVIRSVDGCPISSFCVHEHDGSNRVGAHPRRYIFTGHTDGSIQVWDLTTALSSFKSSPGLTAANFAADEHLNLGAFPIGTVSTLTTGPVTSNAYTVTPVGIIPTSGCPVYMCAPQWPGGPTSRELIQMLEFCQLDTSSSVTSIDLAAPSPGHLTPSESLSTIYSDLMSGGVGIL
ncbi:BTB/POZ domain-containing protein KCTD3 [Paragonimus heterotremus]|uniref:BTB/POZ domain-containing protein KCTD3 n=1 Tax=Paragonimus heterotremus TaxID=100268 RepID=A0A8J4SNT6_9TREM|nr:BTB/POZ domain-containing protein KCTD3 [Paragonimus heterotremus]